MRVGVPKETKIHEYRVGLSPVSVAEVVHQGHEVWVETCAGEAIGYSDEDYRAVGAVVVDQQQAFSADLVVKVKEPSLAECDLMGPDQVLFTYLHLAAAEPQAKALMRRGTTAIAYETVEDAAGRLPLLTPMSEVAGRMSVQVGAYALQKASGGRGTLLGGVPGVAPGRVVVLGGGVAGTNAAYMATGLQAQVTILDRSIDRLRVLSGEFSGRAELVMASREAIRTAIRHADLVVGAVLIPGAAAPKLVDRELLGEMPRGSAVVDISIDQGGCFETSRPTSHNDPTFVEQGVVHYCVTNMPGAVARTSTQALNNVTLPYVLRLANQGWERALEKDPLFRKGLNVAHGRIQHASVAEALGI